jgi:hypothetical protein
MTRAKFVCASKSDNGQTGENKGFTVSLNPVTSGSAENEEFYRLTPGGSVTLSTINEAAADSFEVGKEYYVDFTPAN